MWVRWMYLGSSKLEWHIRTSSYESHSKFKSRKNRQDTHHLCCLWAASFHLSRFVVWPENEHSRREKLVRCKHPWTYTTPTMSCAHHLILKVIMVPEQDGARTLRGTTTFEVVISQTSTFLAYSTSTSWPRWTETPIAQHIKIPKR